MLNKRNPQIGDRTNVLFSLKENVYKVISNSRSSLMGQILTIVDASARDEEQRKAIKDLVRNAFWANPELPEHYDIDEIFGQFSFKYKGKSIEKLPSYDENGISAGDQNWFPNKD